MSNKLVTTFGAASLAALSTFNSVAVADEADLAIEDILNSMQGKYNEVHVPVDNPLLEEIALYYGDQEDLIGQIQSASAGMPDLDSDAITQMLGGEDMYNSNPDDVTPFVEQLPAGSSLNYVETVPASYFVISEAWEKYKKNYADDVAMTAEEPYIVKREDIPVLMQAYKEYYDRFTYIHDEEQYGTVEDWRPAQPMDDVYKNNVADDCDGFALGFPLYLNQNYGIDISATSTVVGLTAEGLGHALALVRTEEGDILFDNNGVPKFPHELLAEGFDFRGAQSLIDKSVWQAVSVTGIGELPRMADIPDYVEEVAPEAPVPRSRPAKLDL